MCRDEWRVSREVLPAGWVGIEFENRYMLGPPRNERSIGAAGFGSPWRGAIFFRARDGPTESSKGKNVTADSMHLHISITFSG